METAIHVDRWFISSFQHESENCFHSFVLLSVSPLLVRKHLSVFFLRFHNKTQNFSINLRWPSSWRRLQSVQIMPFHCSWQVAIWCVYQMGVDFNKFDAFMFQYSFKCQIFSESRSTQCFGTERLSIRKSFRFGLHVSGPSLILWFDYVQLGNKLSFRVCSREPSA